MRNEIVKNDRPTRNRILIATPTLGIVRAEWAAARWGQTTPCNWSSSFISLGMSSLFPIGYLVADAQNIAVDDCVRKDFEWLLLHEDDVILPIDCFLRLNEYMRGSKYPVVSGLYYTKSNPPEPLIYRGRGNSYFAKWKMGEKVRVDGVPTGCLIIHSSLLKLMWKESEEYETSLNRKVRRVFETPAKVWSDPEKGNLCSTTGTSDLYWCDRVIKEDVLRRSGWKKLAGERYPFLVDTNIFCKHVDLSTGVQYPL